MTLAEYILIIIFMDIWISVFDLYMHVTHTQIDYFKMKVLMIYETNN